MVPQIKLPAFPDFLRDFIAAQKGDKEAVTRLSKMIPATKKAQREVLTDAILDVLCHTEEALPLFLCSDLRLDPWHDEDGNLKSLTPDNWLLKEVWEWFTVETVNAANSRLRGDPYVPKVRLSQEPNEEEPFPLWLPSDPGQLIIKGQAGAPPGPRGLPVEPEFLKSVKEAIEAVQEQKKKLTAQNVALFWLDQQGRSKNYERPARQLISAARFFKPDTRWKELKERAIQI